jgi:hypothetical protein
MTRRACAGRWGDLSRWSACVVVALALALPAAAEPADDCTWLPDLRCERSGRFDGFQKPIVAPFLFEDPFITTGIYPYYVWHEFPGSSVFRGGAIHVAAVQLRVAITDRVAFIATKDGRAWLRPDLPLLDDREGWFNLAGGFKVSLFEDRDRQLAVATSLRYEAPTGSSSVFQGRGNGLLLPSLSVAKGFGDLHLIADVGGTAPLDSRAESSSIFWHVYADYRVAERFQPFVQWSAVHWVGSGDGRLGIRLADGSTIPLDLAQDALGTGRFEGADVVNLGSRGVSGQDLYTWALGAHIPLTRGLVLSAAYERPLGGDKGIFKQRVTTSLRFEF